MWCFEAVVVVIVLVFANYSSDIKHIYLDMFHVTVGAGFLI